MATHISPPSLVEPSPSPSPTRRFFHRTLSIGDSFRFSRLPRYSFLGAETSEVVASMRLSFLMLHRTTPRQSQINARQRPCPDGWCRAAMHRIRVGCLVFCRVLRIRIGVFNLLRRAPSLFRGRLRRVSYMWEVVVRFGRPRWWLLLLGVGRAFEPCGRLRRSGIGFWTGGQVDQWLEVNGGRG